MPLPRWRRAAGLPGESTFDEGGKQVTSAGRVESGMACHKDAPHDRLFGLRGH